jgi:hypothetical protein
LTSDYNSSAKRPAVRQRSLTLSEVDGLAITGSIYRPAPMVSSRNLQQWLVLLIQVPVIRRVSSWKD